MPVWNTLPTNRDHVLLSSLPILSNYCMRLYFITLVGNGHAVLHEVSCAVKIFTVRENHWIQENTAERLHQGYGVMDNVLHSHIIYYKEE